MTLETKKWVNLTTRSFRSFSLLLLILLAVSIFIPDIAKAAACTLPSTSYGTDSLTANVPSTTTYTLWVNLLAPSSTSNSVLVQVNGNTCFNAGGSSSIPANTWTWVDYQNGSSAQKMQLSLNSGNNTIELIGNEAGVGVSNILLLADASCVPTGSGTNCTTGQPVTVTTTNPSSPSTPASTQSGISTTTSSAGLSLNTINSDAKPVVFTGKTLALNGAYVQLTKPVTITPTYIQGKTIKEVQYYLNNNLIYTSKEPPYTYKLNTNNLENGKYLLTSKTTYTNNQSVIAKEAIDINHAFLTNSFVFIGNNLLATLLVIIILGVAIWQAYIHRAFFKHFYKRKPKDQSFTPLTSEPHHVSPYANDQNTDMPVVIAPNDENISNDEEQKLP